MRLRRTQQAIVALEKKHGALQRLAGLQQMQEETDEINALTGRERRVKINGMRFDTLAGKIRKQERLLNGIGNPLADGHCEQVEGLIATYEEWRKQAALSFGMAKSGWESIKSIGSSIEGITEALRGNGNVWQFATSLIDGFKTVAGIIQMLVSAPRMPQQRAWKTR